MRVKEAVEVHCSLSQRFIFFLFPASLLAATYLYVPYLNLLPQPWRELLPYATYLMLSLGLFLSIHFNRSRAFFILLMLLFYYWNSNSLSLGGLGAASAQRIGSVLRYLVPVNITLFCLMREKGIFTLAGRMRFVFLAAQAAVLLLFGKSDQADAQQAGALIEHAALGWQSLSWFALPLMGGCALTVAVHSFRKKSLIDSGFLGVLAAVVWVCCSPANGETVAVFLFVSGLILAVSILQDSHTMAYRDELTGLLTRRVLNEDLHALGRRYVIAMVDMDHFKRLNDSYGHDIGDQVLRMAADRMRKVGAGGKAYRYGGEEFTILFPRQGLADVLPHLEELRSSIASYRFRMRGGDRPGRDREGKKLRSAGFIDTHISATVSIGVAESCNDRKSPREILVAADEALYRAKQKGRNRVISASGI
jgi:GGDEF domain-containing protein